MLKAYSTVQGLWCDQRRSRVRRQPKIRYAHDTTQTYPWNHKNVYIFLTFPEPVGCFQTLRRNFIVTFDCMCQLTDRTIWWLKTPRDSNNNCNMKSIISTWNNDNCKPNRDVTLKRKTRFRSTILWSNPIQVNNFHLLKTNGKSNIMKCPNWLKQWIDVGFV